jgi:hypothetical protein
MLKHTTITFPIGPTLSSTNFLAIGRFSVINWSIYQTLGLYYASFTSLSQLPLLLELF